MFYEKSTDHLGICKYLIEKMGNKNPADNNGWTPLHLAAFNGNVEITKQLIDYLDTDDLQPSTKSDLNYDEDKLTPIHWAAFKGHSEVCKMIMDKSTEKSPRSPEGNTPLHYAVYGGKCNVCKGSLISEGIFTTFSKKIQTSSHSSNIS